MRRLTTPRLMVLCVLLTAGDAVARPQAPASQPMPFRTTGPASQPSKLQQARSLSKRAGVSYRAGDFARAAALYKKAIELLEHPSLIFNLAQCYTQLGEHKLALFHYEHYLSIWAKLHPGVAAPNTAGVYRAVTRAKLALQAKTAREAASRRPEPKPPTIVIKQGGGDEAAKRARLRVSGVDVNGARVLVDGMLKAVAPVTHLITVEPGLRQVIVEAKGRLPWRRQVNAQAGEVTLVPVTLEEPPERSTGWLLLTVGTLVAAAGMEAMAVYFTLEANKHVDGTRAFDDDAKLATVGHAVAAGLAALAAVPLYFYLVSDRVDGEKPPSAAAAIVPQPGGAAAVGVFRF